jgi:hypothetical protein
MKRFLLPLLLLIGMPTFAQFQWLPNGTYDPKVPTPESVFGYEIGDYLTDNLQMVDYIHQLQASTNRVKVFQYGVSVERRKLWLIAISSPEHIQKLEEIRGNIEKLTDPRLTTPAQANEIAATTVPIGWMNYGTDGGETSAFEAGLQVAYQLAAGTDPLTMKILNNMVVIINPVLNPDSHQPYVAWMKSNTILGGTADPNASEHHGEWFIESDGNHYLVDLNRDAYALTQPETQAASKALHHWNPQVWIDNHGEPNEYYMGPFATPVNLNYPESLKKWSTLIGKNTSKAFDQYGWTYAKAENYDLYFPGYWDSYPAFNGAIAATYESSGGGKKGFQWERPDGSISTLRNAIHKHFAADIATLEVLADNRKEILSDYYNFFKKGMDETSTEPFKTYIIHEQNDPVRARELVSLLQRHHIEVYKATSSVSVKKAQTYFDRNFKAKTFEAGSYIIPLRQPKKRLIKTLLEADTRMEDSFLRDVAARRERDAKLGSAAKKEGHGFYDVTSWALPVQYGVEASFSEDEVAVSNMEKVSNLSLEGKVTGGKATYAYAFSQSQTSGTKLAAKLLQMDYKVAYTLQATQVDGVQLGKGTYLVRVDRNPADVHETIESLAKELGAEVKAINTAWGDGGISLGSKYVAYLQKPKIMVMTQEPTRAVTYGSVYSVLTQRFGLDFTPVRTSMFNDINLYRYNVIIFPDGSAADYEKMLGKEGVAELANWIKNGGTFIGLKGGAAFTARKEVGLSDVELVAQQKNDSGKAIENVAGSMFKAEVNNDYYLGMGYGKEIGVQFRGNYHLSPSAKGTNVITFKPQGHISGHQWDTTENDLAGKLYLADIPHGDGHIILFANDPTFRAYWRGLDRLFVGAIILPGGF